MGVKPFSMGHELIWTDPDIFVIRVPFAHLGLVHTNCYIVRDGDDVLVIDLGVPSPAAKQTFTRAITDIGVDLSNARFFCTHLHFDHVALLKKISKRGSHIVMSRTAFELNPWNNYRTRKSSAQKELRRQGFAQLSCKGLAAVMAESRVHDLPGRVYDCVVDGDILQVGKHKLRVIETPGHAQGHLCLYIEEQRILFTGDHVLEKITPGLALPINGTDSVGDYFDSLNKVDSLPVHVVLPAHGKTFYDLHGRCDDLRNRHVMRIVQAYEVVALNPGIEGDDVLHKMPWKKKGPFKPSVWERLSPQLRLSMGVQTLAYLEYLVNLGEIKREEIGGTYHYSIV